MSNRKERDEKLIVTLKKLDEDFGMLRKRYLREEDCDVYRADEIDKLRELRQKAIIDYFIEE